MRVMLGQSTEEYKINHRAGGFRRAVTHTEGDKGKTVSCTKSRVFVDDPTSCSLSTEALSPEGLLTHTHTHT